MGSAFEGLERKLEELSHVIMREVEQSESDVHILAAYGRLRDNDAIQRFRTAWRNSKLKAYRDRALKVPVPREEHSRSRLTARLFSYIHNEFNFNAPRPITRAARVTHLVFAPLYIEKTQERHSNGDAANIFGDEVDPYKTLSGTTAGILDFLWKEAHHKPSQKNLRGGKDKIFDYVRETFDFTEPYITLKRSIVAKKDAILARAGSVERALTQQYEERVQAAGLSNRLTNTVEFFVSAPPRTAHFRWTRHARPYQTFTLTDEAGTRTLQGEQGAPFSKVALHAFPEDLFDEAFGRYVQGANYLIVPIELFFNRALFTHSNEKTGAIIHMLRMFGLNYDSRTPPTFAEVLAGLSDTYLESKVVEIARHLVSKDKERLEATLVELGRHPEEWDKPNSDEIIAAIFDLINSDKEKAVALDRFVIAVTESYLNRCFGEDEAASGSARAAMQKTKPEYVGNKCMDGRAYVFSNLGNNHSVDEEGRVNPIQEMGDIFTRTVIVDCGMNRFQRGRIIQNLTEFATERTMSLLWIARFRLIHNAMNAIEARLNLAVSNYHNGKEQLSSESISDLRHVEEADGSIVPEDYWRDLNPGLKFDKDTRKQITNAARERKLIVALEFLSSCLTVLNSYVEGGIVDRASGTTASIEMLNGKLDSIREQPIIGHQSLRDFMRRRFVPASRVIGRTGERYRRLRERIAEVSSLIDAKLSATEWHKHQIQAQRQIGLLSIAEFFGESALGYYSSSLLVEFLGSSCRRAVHGAFYCEPMSGLGHTGYQISNNVEYDIYGTFVLLVMGLVIWSAQRMLRERND